MLVEIPKPDGGVRKLGSPTVTDRIIQQAITQQLIPIFEPLFSDGSYGYDRDEVQKMQFRKLSMQKKDIQERSFLTCLSTSIR